MTTSDQLLISIDVLTLRNSQLQNKIEDLQLQLKRCREQEQALYEKHQKLIEITAHPVLNAFEMRTANWPDPNDPSTFELIEIVLYPPRHQLRAPTKELRDAVADDALRQDITDFITHRLVDQIIKSIDSSK